MLLERRRHKLHFFFFLPDDNRLSFHHFLFSRKVTRVADNHGLCLLAAVSDILQVFVVLHPPLPHLVNTLIGRALGGTLSEELLMLFVVEHIVGVFGAR